jgi:thioredoxin 1
MMVSGLMLMSTLVALAGCGSSAPPTVSNNLRLIDNARQSGQPTVVEFGSDSCTSCRRMKVVMDAVAQQTRGHSHVLVMDVIKDSSLQQAFRISMIPTQVFFDGTGNEVWRHLGPLTEVQVIERLGLVDARIRNGS